MKYRIWLLNFQGYRFVRYDINSRKKFLKVPPVTDWTLISSETMTITKLRSLELLIQTPLLHILYYINGLTHDFWTRTGGWEFDRSHGTGTSSPSHLQQVEEQAPKPVGWAMCFLLMTLVPAQKLCVNICVYVYMYIPYTSSVIGRIHNGSVIQYWRSCTPSRSIGECAVPGLNAILCFLWFTNCVLLFDKNLIVYNNILILGIWCSTIPHLPGCFVPGPSLRISDSTRCQRTPLCHI